MPNPKSPAGDTDDRSTVTNDQSDADVGNLDAKDDAKGTSTEAGEKGAKEPELDLEAVVRKAAGQDEDGAEATPADGKDGENPDPGDATPDDTTAEGKKPEGKSVEEQAAEDAKLPFHKHPRWQEVLRERDRYKAQVDQQATQVTELSTKAERLDRIGGFMRDNDLSAEEVQRGFEIMATMKHDPAKALELLSPHLENLQLVTGQRLPKDLQDRVDAGTMDAEGAQLAARDRVGAMIAQDKAKRAEQAVEVSRQQTTQESQVKLGQAMRSAVEAWETDVKGRDPDYPHMQSFVIDRSRALSQATPPKSPEDAVTLVKQAYDEVKAKMRKVLPNKAATRTVTSDKSSTTAAPAPTSLEGIVRQALRK